MSTAGGNGLPLASRLYKSRTLGLTLGFVCVVFGMYPLHPPLWVWAWMLINAFVWPHIAYQWSRRASNSLRGMQGVHAKHHAHKTERQPQRARLIQP